MRQARVEDYRRYLTEKTQRWSLAIDRFAFANIPSLGSLEIPFAAPLTVICGPNGVGKSTLLASVRAALNADDGSPLEDISHKLSGGSAQINITVKKTPLELGVEFGGGAVRRILGDAIPITFVNTGATVHLIQDGFASFVNVEELLNGAGSKTLSEDDVYMLSYITQRDYRRIVLSELELGDIVPFFEVSYENDNYDSRTMGSGELAAFQIWWTMQQAEANSLVLIEEPESFLSPASQEAIGNFLIATAFDKGLCVLMTSHSSPIIAPLPKACVKYFYRGANGIRLADDPGPLYLRKIGVSRPVSSIVFVEDHAGKAFTKLLLERCEGMLASTISIEVKSGEAEITKALAGVGKLNGPIKLLGMYDGDMRGKIEAGYEDVSMFLPGTDPIETIFRGIVRNAPNDLALARGVSEGKVAEILFGLEGANHHDWYEGIAAGLGLSKEQLFANLFVIWIRAEDNARMVEDWCKQISAKLA